MAQLFFVGQFANKPKFGSTNLTNSPLFSLAGIVTLLAFCSIEAEASGAF